MAIAKPLNFRIQWLSERPTCFSIHENTLKNLGFNGDYRQYWSASEIDG